MGMDNLEREIEDAENEINRLRRENEELKAKLSETVIRLAARNSEIAELQDTNKGLQTDLDDGREYIEDLQAKLDKANWRDINYAPIDVWVLINVSGDVVRAIKRDSNGIYYWFPHAPEGRSCFTWANDMVLGWMPLPDSPEQPWRR